MKCGSDPPAEGHLGSLKFSAMSKGSFKIRPVPETKVYSPRPLQNGNVRLKWLPGEHIVEDPVNVRKLVQWRSGESFLSGTLYCTEFRLTFVPEHIHNAENEDHDSVLNREHDIPLISIDRVTVNQLPKTKAMTASSGSKFGSKELVIYCKDFRIVKFQLEQSTREEQIHWITTKLTQGGDLFALQYENAVLQNQENCPFSGMMDFPTCFFEQSSDWEQELERTGTSGWRVSPINERFDMSTSLPKYIVVPLKLFDYELKAIFTHFNDGHIPRWCWHHPGGSNLLRMGSFRSNTYLAEGDARKMEILVQGNLSQAVIADVSTDLPSPSDIQTAYLKFKTLCMDDASIPVSDEKWLSALENTHWLDHVRLCLKKAGEVSSLLACRCVTVILQELDDADLNCLVSSLVQLLADPHYRTISGFQSLVQKEWLVAGHRFLQRLNLTKGSDKEESPVFLLFLDCVWQLLNQYPLSFEFTEVYLLALRDSTTVPLFSTFLFNSQWERSRRNQHQASKNNNDQWDGRQSSDKKGILLKGRYQMIEERSSALPSVWEWALQYPSQQRACFRNPLYTGSTCPASMTGNLDLHNDFMADSGSLTSSSVYLLAKGSLSPQAQPLPWKHGSGPKIFSRRTQSTESLSDMERTLRGKPKAASPLDGMIFPLVMGPLIRLWGSCYLRETKYTQITDPASCYFMVTEVANEVEFLQTRLIKLQAGNGSNNSLDYQGNKKVEKYIKRLESSHSNGNPYSKSPLLPMYHGTFAAELSS
ncbi:myotubularin-related protein 11 [Latimeria chalumnae]|uniref:myotubularin-related protein 11 n=1 Tax=Latimeria chalumnae TaxID=7897 RepID=UPI0003C188D8|nr:PREDICTED: myotubularin-related protein 11 [Latimeria chalumnae]|eukprot:XP_006007685.1 PREDICTED: myotubularin-related protein 11 [Latimeria chalumnae]